MTKVVTKHSKKVVVKKKASTKVDTKSNRKSTRASQKEEKEPKEPKLLPPKSPDSAPGEEVNTAVPEPTQDGGKSESGEKPDKTPTTYTKIRVKMEGKNIKGVAVFSEKERDETLKGYGFLFIGYLHTNQTNDALVIVPKEFTRAKDKPDLIGINRDKDNVTTYDKAFAILAKVLLIKNDKGVVVPYVCNSIIHMLKKNDKGKFSVFADEFGKSIVNNHKYVEIARVYTNGYVGYKKYEHTKNVVLRAGKNEPETVNNASKNTSVPAHTGTGSNNNS